MKKIYKAHLKNDQGCIFDQTESLQIKHIKNWALVRSGNYKLIVESNDKEVIYYDVSNDTIKEVHRENNYRF